MHTQALVNNLPGLNSISPALCFSSIFRSNDSPCCAPSTVPNVVYTYKVVLIQTRVRNGGRLKRNQEKTYNKYDLPFMIETNFLDVKSRLLSLVE